VDCVDQTVELINWYMWWHDVLLLHYFFNSFLLSAVRTLLKQKKKLNARDESYLASINT
jgi:hypothetical protein